MRILYVEDNQANLFLVQRVARMGGHQVIAYDNGEQALANFNTDKPDLILMDVQLSGALSGLDVVRRIRSQGHKMPVVAVTAYAMVGDRERCMEAGCDAYLSKPLPVAELVEIIRRYAAEALVAAAPLPAVPTAAAPVPAAPTTAAVVSSDGAAAAAVVSSDGAAAATVVTTAPSEPVTETQEAAPPKAESTAPAPEKDATEPKASLEKPAAPDSSEKKMEAAAST